MLMTRAPATYQTRARRSVAPLCSGWGLLAYTNRINHSRRSKSATVCQREKTSKYVHARSQEPARSDTNTWLQPLKIIWIILEPMSESIVYEQ